MFGQLAGKAAEALGRAYLLAGLFPAIVLVGGIYFLTTGSDDFSGQLQRLVSDDHVALTGLGLAVLALSILFTIIREALVSFIEEVPWRILDWLRNFLVTWQLKTRQCVQDSIDEKDTEYSALQWVIQITDPKSPLKPYAPPRMAVPAWNKLAKCLKLALEDANDLTKHSATALTVISPRTTARIIRGVCGLYTFLARNEANPVQAADDEVAKWRAWRVAHPDASLMIVNLIRDHVQRSLALFTARRKSFPDGLWVKPTRVGNTLSALDDYGKTRYGIETYLLWRRLWWSLPETARTDIGDTRVTIQALLSLSVAALILALFSAFYIGANLIHASITYLCYVPPFPVATPLSMGMLVSSSLVATLAAAVFYELSVHGTASLVQKIASLIDTHRLPFLTSLWLPPENPREELEMFKELREFWKHGEPLDGWREYSRGAEKEDG